WQLPDVSGIEVLKALRDMKRNTPVIMLTGKTRIAEKELGLDAGADDYLTKPFEINELGARIRALIRRASGSTSYTLTFGNIKLDPKKQSVTQDGVNLSLAPGEFALLEYFMRHPGKVLSVDQLLNAVWTSDSEAGGDAIRSCIKRLRKKFDDGDGMIETVHRQGYRFNPPSNNSLGKPGSQ
ncbi:MAG: response regulator transcription factor, partial [Cyanobacteria bacterium]|nr:response regulator transcription factor [Cyanobacteriota bacterium]